MPVLTAGALSKSFGSEDIFSSISFSLPHHARVGLVGPNGVGKTTLLRILAGLEEPGSGSVTVSRNLKIGYLPQNAVLQSENTLWDECLTVFSNLLAKQAELTRLEALMADKHTDSSQAETILEAYGRQQSEFERLGGYTYESRMRSTLTGMGFAEEDLHRPLAQLSGGERTRAYFVKLLLSEPDLLLLDEPTNHLDIAAIEWLEAYFKDWRGATLIVSHDRYFLNQVVNTIWEMTPALEIYRGNYNAYTRQRAERYKQRLQDYRRQQEFIDKEEDYIRRNIAGQNTRQAQGRRKRLERMLDEAMVVRPLDMNARKLNLNLGQAARSGDLVLRTRDLVIGYQDDKQPLINVPDLLLKRGDCAALIGPNGAGKTTFLKTILEQIPPLSGETILGASLKIGYFAQAHEGLHLDWTLMQEIDHAAPNMLPADIRNYLARFLFTEDDVFKEVKVLSGGERGRLALALLALQGANLLLLDEPTNNLDIASQEVLQSVLSEFGGTILLVSHDRYLIDALATHVWEIEPGAKSLIVFEGSYSEYRAERLAEAGKPAPAQPAENGGQKPYPAQGKKPAAQKAQEALKAPQALSKWEIKQQRERLTLVEMKIIELEGRQAAIENRLANPPRDPAEVQRLGESHQLILAELEKLMDEWGRISELLADNRYN
jgi:ATP-binding cassette subfamily F protein 3